MGNVDITLTNNVINVDGSRYNNKDKDKDRNKDNDRNNVKDNEKGNVDIGLTNDVINVDGSKEKDEDISFILLHTFLYDWNYHDDDEDHNDAFDEVCFILQNKLFPRICISQRSLIMY